MYGQFGREEMVSSFRRKKLVCQSISQSAIISRSNLAPRAFPFEIALFTVNFSHLLNNVIQRGCEVISG